MVTIDNVKEQYIMPLLESTGYSFNIVTDVGEFQKAVRIRNTVQATINGLLMLTQSEVQKLSGGAVAIAYQAMIQFLLPIGDTPVDNEFPTVAQFRKALSDAFSNATKISVKDEQDNSYEGGVVYSLPTVGQRNQRDMVGDSVTYTCTVSVAFLQNAINTSDLALYIDGEQVAFSLIRLARMPALTADILSRSDNGESGTYAESAAFNIDFSLPALKNVAYSTAIMSYITGKTSANKPVSVTVTQKVSDTETVNLIREKIMIFGKGEFSGNGVSNVVYTVSLVPYTEPETVGG